LEVAVLAQQRQGLTEQMVQILLFLLLLLLVAVVVVVLKVLETQEILAVPVVAHLKFQLMAGREQQIKDTLVDIQ
jgi:hypothetical protein